VRDLFGATRHVPRTCVLKLIPRHDLDFWILNSKMTGRGVGVERAVSEGDLTDAGQVRDVAE
jgi:hypothetical protein